MINRPDTNAQRLKRHKRVRGKISGTPERPRLNVFRSNTNIYAQVIDDVTGKTLVSASSLEKGFEGKGSDCEAAKKVGLAVAERAKAAGIETVVFDRGGYVYHGRVQALAEGASEGQRLKRHKRVRGKISGTPERPRLNVFRSNTNIYAQVIDDVTGKTLVSASSLEKGFEGKGSDCEAAKKVGLAVAERAKAAGIETVVFDRGGYVYHGRVQALAEGAREGGLQF